jgi:hypothetical protein
MLAAFLFQGFGQGKRAGEKGVIGSGARPGANSGLQSSVADQILRGQAGFSVSIPIIYIPLMRTAMLRAFYSRM